jgi:hypothetical protein
MTEAKKRQLANSDWIVNKEGKLGMIAEINSNQAMVYLEKSEGGLEESATFISVDDLALAPAASVPPRAGLTAEQLAEYGYV